MYFLVHWPFIDFKTVNAKGILDFLKVAALYFELVNA